MGKHKGLTLWIIAIAVVLTLIGLMAIYVFNTDRNLALDLKNAQREELRLNQELQGVEETLQKLDDLSPSISTEGARRAWSEAREERLEEQASYTQRLFAQQEKVKLLKERIAIRKALKK